MLKRTFTVIFTIFIFFFSPSIIIDADGWFDCPEEREFLKY